MSDNNGRIKILVVCFGTIIRLCCHIRAIGNWVKGKKFPRTETETERERERERVRNSALAP
jgi:hypothetical protein